MQVVEPGPVLQLARAAVDAVGEGELVAGGLPVQHEVAPRSAGRWHISVEPLAAQQVGEVDAHLPALEKLDDAAVAELVENAIGQRERPARS
jgi:hypothetical protein